GGDGGDGGDGGEKFSSLLSLPCPSRPLPQILLADDNSDMRDYVKRILSKNYEVVAVRDGAAALAAIDKQLPDLVLTDVMMPVVDGFELLRQIRTEPRTKEIPVILLSARAGEESKIEGLETGADDYLIKPFSARELIARVRTTLEMALLRRESARRDRELRAEAEFAKERLEAVLASISDGFVVFDAQWRYTYVNDRIVEILGKSKEELLGKCIWDLFPDLVSTEYYPQLHRASQENASIQFEAFYPPWNRWYENRIYPLQDQLSMCVADITERKQAQEALRESEERYRILTEVSPQFVWMGASDGSIIYCNQHWFDYTGLTMEQTSGDAWVAVLHPDDRDRILRIWKDAVAKGTYYEVEMRFRRTDGEYRWHVARGLPFRDHLGQILKWIGIGNDIHERKCLEEERARHLQREQQRVQKLGRLNEASMEINAVSSLEGTLQLIAQQAYEIVGAHQSLAMLVVNQDWEQAAIAVSLSQKYAQWHDYAEKHDGSGIYACVCNLNRPIRMTQAELEADPQWREFGKEADRHPPMRGWLAVPLTDREGRNMGLIQLSDKYEGEFTAEDEALLVQLGQIAAIALENVRLYSAEQSARASAEAANRLKDEFLAVLSHELRSPLNPILGWSRLLRSRKFDAVATDRALETIERNAKLQTQLIEDLLDVSRILQGKLTLDVTNVDLVATIAGAMETVNLAAIAKSIELRTQFEADRILISGDANRLQQVFWNLLSNAVKFTPAGGYVEISLKRAGMCVQIRVSDTGKGIDREFLPYVFECFRQADSTTTRKFGGLGLGLAIVRHLVELHGGTVKADSAGLGLGATFEVILPLLNLKDSLSEDEVNGDAESLISNPLEGMRVLVVDDEPDTRELIAFILSDSGAEVTLSASATEALATLARFKFDVLVSDIGMAEMDGYMLISQLRSQSEDRGGQVPAIALTAYAGELNQQQALRAGFSSHLAKPIEPADLIAAIANFRSLPNNIDSGWAGMKEK
ncbi:MAG TPA: response regulator, partial [Kamptonema sp.]|nr:response regulator [Kamptonema sp.]